MNFEGISAVPHFFADFQCKHGWLCRATARLREEGHESHESHESHVSTFLWWKWFKWYYTVKDCISIQASIQARIWLHQHFIAFLFCFCVVVWSLLSDSTALSGSTRRRSSRILDSSRFLGLSNVGSIGSSDLSMATGWRAGSRGERHHEAWVCLGPARCCELVAASQFSHSRNHTRLEVNG
jgi:hypothetical protein